MKYFLIILSLIQIAFADYKIIYNNLTLGEMKTFDTISNGYLKAKITNGLVSFIINKDFVFFYNDSYKNKDSFNKKNNNIKYKKDNQGIIEILNSILNNKENFNHTNIRNLTGAIKDIESIANPQPKSQVNVQQNNTTQIAIPTIADMYPKKDIL